MSNINQFVYNYRKVAERAGQEYGLPFLFILAQGAFESAWGTSLNAKEGHNFFGVIATKSWQGKVRKAGTGLLFRVYPSDLDSFRDFARLITTKAAYREAARSTTIEDYAQHIAYSPYISETNGDNRESYRKGLIWCAHQIEKYL